MANKKKNKSRRRIIFITLAVVVIALIVAKRMGVISPEPLVGVVVEKPQVRTITELVTANGKVQPEIEVKIAPEVSGEIVELAIKEGDFVNKGDLLIRIKPDTYISMKERSEAQLASSVAQQAQTQAQLETSKLVFERQKKLFQQGAISESEYESAEGQYNQLLAQLEAAIANIDASEAALKQANEDLMKTTIYAPSSGTVSKLSVELGERVVGTATMAGTEMLRLADLGNMEVRAEVNENDIVRVQMGDSAKIEIDAYLGRKFDGVVTRIANSSISTSTSADQVTSYEVRIMIVPESYKDLLSEGSPSPFRPSMSSTVDIMTNTVSALSVPIGAVTTRSGEGAEKRVVIFTYSSDSSMVIENLVTTGVQDKDYVVIESGLSEDSEVVTGPFSVVSKELKNKQSVELKQSLFDAANTSK